MTTCNACRHCFMEPDDDFCCGHPDAGPMGTYIKHAAAVGGHCGPDRPKFEQHPLRKSNGDLCEMTAALRAQGVRVIGREEGAS